MNGTDLEILLQVRGPAGDDWVLADLDHGGEIETADLLTLLADRG